MRHLGWFLLAACPATILAQTPAGDTRVLETLLTEVQQLRMAIERQTLLGTRTQIAISQLQLQESRAAAVGKELLGVRDEAVHLRQNKLRQAAGLKSLEEKISLGAGSPSALQDEIQQMKWMAEESAAREEQLTMREGELTAQFQAAQREVQESRTRISEMERALDAAIQQILKPK